MMKSSTTNRRLLPTSGSWFRFSLRTLMVVTVFVAFGVRWWMKPELTKYSQPDGTTVRYSLVKPLDPATKQPMEPRRHGRYEVRDKFGRLLVRGQYDQGLPVGSWRAFYSNGRKAIRGATVSGEHSGTWTAWNETGSKIAQASYQLPATPRPMSAGKFTAPWFAKRVGVGETRDEHGRLSRGKFVNDMRDGEWIDTDSTGRVIARSQFRWGVRHGKTAETDISGVTRETYYLYGHRLPPFAELLLRLREDLQSDDGGRQYEALRTVVLLGEPAEPLVLEVLAKGDDSLRIFAMRFLVLESSTSNNVHRRIEQIARTSEDAVAIEAWFALYELVPSRQIEVGHQLLELAARSNLPVRYTIGYRLGRQAGSVADSLDHALESNDPALRRVAMETLTVMLFTSPKGEHKNRDTKLKQLLTKARSSEDWSIATAAADVARSLPDRMAASPSSSL